MTSNKERQEDEYEAINAIYPGCVEDLRKKHPWKVWLPLELRLTLGPQDSGGGSGRCFVQVDLMVKCSNEYPDKIPSMKLENSKGLSNEQLSTLSKELLDLAEKHLGEEMILQLATHVQGFLHRNNNPPITSFYEQMVNNQRMIQESKERAKQKELEYRRMLEEKTNQEIQDELNRRQEAFRDAVKQHKAGVEARNQHISKSSENVTEPVSARRSPLRSRSSTSPSSFGSGQEALQCARRTSISRRTSESEEDTSCKQHHGMSRIVFNSKTERIIERGRCTRHNDRGSTIFTGVDAKTGSLVTIREWVLKWRHMGEGEDTEGSKLKKQVQSVESELKTLLHLRHDNLVSYLSMTSSCDTGQITAHVLSDFTGECNLDGMYLKQEEAVPLPLLRLYTIDLVNALDYLHTNDIVHKDLRAASVFIGGRGQARLADFSIVKRLYDLLWSTCEARPRVHFPDAHPTVYCRPGKKGDIYLLGLLLLSLAEGSEMVDASTEIPDHLHPHFQEFLAKCLIELDKDRPSASQLLQHRFIQEPLVAPVQDSSSLEESAKSGQAKNGGSKSPEEDEDLDDVPLLTTLEECGKSRIMLEFEILRSLGKGGYGDVIKVKNRLDGKCYAIKRVRLEPKSKNFNKKIMREVQLLSSLNHENIVRYYNSWIETSEETSAISDTSTLSSKMTETRETPPECIASPQVPNANVNSLGLIDDIEQFAPQQVETSLDWTSSLSFGHGQSEESDDEDSEDDEDDNSDVFGFSARVDSPQSIVFGSDVDSESQKDQSEEAKPAGNKPAESSLEVAPTPEKQSLVQFLYIQMEYCEKSTLRNCIDDSLYQKPNRKWRLFREIVEGLTHIHSKNLIHRDLKPVNIFLDSLDHVKIGDFGLATARMDHKGPVDPSTLMRSGVPDLLLSPSPDSNLTGGVGTALYVSPEMMSDTKVIYDQKVDIYSLGIIFFEMSYRPLSTGMERVKVLGNLRQRALLFPEDFDEHHYSREVIILRWLLDHNPHSRPTAHELLHCETLPPPQMEDNKMDEIIRATFAAKRTKLYHRMVETMFEQKVNKATELVYELDLHKDLYVETLLMQQMVRGDLERLFGRHGAVPISLPLLLPRLDLYRANPQSANFIDPSGIVVSLPYELRVNFARYIAKNNIQRLKRYTIERVFRKSKASDHHPKEIVECAFDVVTHALPPATPDKTKYFPDVEVLCLAQEVIKNFPPLKARNYYIRISHMTLLCGILRHCGIPEDKLDFVLNQLDLQPELWKRPQDLMRHCELSLSEQNASHLQTLLSREESIREISASVKLITRTKTQASAWTKSGLQDIGDILDLAKAYGLSLEVKVAPGLIFHPRQFSGMVFQVVYNKMRKNTVIQEPLAAGGRYDKLVKYFYGHFIGPLGARGIASQLPMSSQPPQAVGVSFAFSHITAAFTVSKDQRDQPEQQERPSLYDVLVCTQSNRVSASERLTVLGRLIREGLRAEIKPEPLQDADSLVEECRVSGCSQIVILHEPDYNQGQVMVRSVEKDKQTVTTTKKILLNELAGYLKQKIGQTYKMESTEGWQASSSRGSHLEGAPVNSAGSSASSSMSFSFTFVTETKLAYNTRRRMEVSIQGKVNAAFSWVPTRTLEVIVGDFDLNAVQTLSAFLVLDKDEAEFDESVSRVMDKLSQLKNKKNLAKVTDKICELRFDKKCQFIVLYSQKDESIKLLF